MHALKYTHVLSAVAVCLAVLSSCSSKPQPVPYDSDAEVMQLKGRVRSVTFVDEGILGIEQCTLDLTELVEYRIELAAYCFVDDMQSGRQPGSAMQFMTSANVVEPAGFEYYNMEDPRNNADAFAVQESLFDTLGNLTEQHRYRAASAGGYSEHDLYETDDAHRRTRVDTYNAQGEHVSWSSNEYDALGNCTMSASWFFGEPVNTAYTVYDEKGHPLDEQHYEGDELLWHTSYEYNRHGRMIAQNNYSTIDGSLGSHYTYQYNRRGNLTEQRVYNADTLTQTDIYEYNRKGQTVREISVYEGDTVRLVRYTYDKHGNVTIADYEIDQWSGRHIISSEYDEAGNLTAYRYDSEDMLALLSSTYDSLGRETQNVSCNYPAGKTQVCQTDYDAMGAVTERRYFMALEGTGDSANPDIPLRLVSREAFLIDQHGNWTRREVYYTTIAGGEVLVGLQTRQIIYYIE